MFNKSSQPTEADLRDSYRQRLNEILGSPAKADQAGTAVLETPAEQPESVAVTPTQTQPPAPVCEAAPPPPSAPAREEPEDVFARAAQNLARSLTECWLGTMGEIQRLRSLDQDKLDSSMNELGSVRGELQALQGSVAALHQQAAQQAEQTASLEQAVARISQRLDAQAQAIRSLCAAAEAESNRRDQFRATLEQLREAINTTPQPVALPQDL